MSKHDRNAKRNRLHREMTDALRSNDLDVLDWARQHLRDMDADDTARAQRRRDSRLNIVREHKRVPLVPAFRTQRDAVRIDLPRLRGHQTRGDR